MMTIVKGSFFTVIFFFAFLHCRVSYGQSYGLGFHSHTVVQDKRTSLDLFPTGTYCPGGDFELSFELNFLPGYDAYFGYIFRIIKDDKENIDFIYDERSNLHKRFKMVLGEDLTSIAFDLDSNRIFRKWNKFRVKFDLHNDQIIFFTDSNSFVQKKVGLSTHSCFKLFFGTTQYKQFQVTDVPPMKIRNIQLFKQGVVQRSWPLDERDGTVAHELVNNAGGTVLNPVWIRNEHYAWKEEQDLMLKGYASVAFNPEKEQLYIADGDSLLTWSVANGRLTGTAYATGPQPLLRGNQSLYSPVTATLYNMYIDHRLVTSFDFARSGWDKDHRSGPVTDFWHFNKFFSSIDTSLYFLGGYGHFQYLNSMFRYHLPTQTWDTVSYSGDHVVPRYLFALAATPNTDSVYMLGGYGSQTGQQILKPQSIYDMMLFDVKRRKFKKLFEIKPAGEDFAFANSLVLDPRTHSYYGLIFPNYRYASHLQLIKGSLSNPSYQVVGDTIPYSFHDVTSSSDLFFAPASDKFVAVTMLTDTLKRTHLHIFSLTAPPVTADSPYPVVSGKQEPGFIKYVLGTLLILGIATVVLLRRRRPLPASLSAAAPPVSPPSPEPAPSPEPPSLPSPELPPVNSLFLFGEMQIFDKEGTDITRQFTPLIRELFLLIVLYSVRKGTGVSSDKLTEILWSDKSTQSARNNRSVNIAKLKSLLDRLEHVQLSKDTGYWKIDLDPSCTRLDYLSYLAIVKDKKKLDKDRINQLAEITQRGSFLSNIEYEWLDEYKSEVSNEIIDTYIHFAHSIPIKEDPDFLVRLANYIFYFDAVNEEAIAVKCKALAYTGKHSLAKAAFDNFVRQYKTLYGEEYKKDFQELLEA